MTRHNSQKGKMALYVVLALIVALGAYGVYSSQAPEPASKKGPIKIGATLALSGKFANIGQSKLNALKMAEQEINDAGGIDGRRLEIVTADNKGQARAAVKNVQWLLDVKDSDIIITGFTHTTNAVKKMVRDKGKMLFYASTVEEIAREGDYTFRDYMDARSNGRAVAEAVKEAGYDKVAFLRAVGEDYLRYKQGFKKQAEKYGIEIVAEAKIKKSGNDLKTPLTKLKGEADALVTGTAFNSHKFMSRLKELGMMDMQTFHWAAPFLPVADTPEMRKLYEENNAITTWYGPPEETEREKTLEFRRKYRARYGSDPIPDAAYLYDDVKILAKALRNCDADLQDKDCIREEILSTDYEGAGGHVEFDKHGSAEREVFLMKVKNGTWHEVQR